MGMLIVGISDIKVAQPPDTLITYALGSCVGICLHDPSAKVGGLAHIMLPSIRLAPGDQNHLKFADTAIPLLIERMEQLGAFRSRITAKLAGGAQMFTGKSFGDDPFWQIGKRNVAAAIDTLDKLQIRIVAADVLEEHGRTVSFDPATGAMQVSALGKVKKEL